MGEKKRTGAVFILLLLAVVLVAQLAGNMTRSSDVSYGEMREYFTEEKVRSFTATDRRLTAKLADDTAVSCPLQSFNTFYNDLNDLVVSQSEKGIITDYNYAAEGRTNWLSALLPYVLAAMAFILLMNLIARTGGMNSGVNDKMARFGEARIQDIPDQGKKVTFKDDLEVMMPCPPMQLTEYATRPYTSAGRLGADTDSIFHDLGYTDSEIAAMKDSGAIQ